MVKKVPLELSTGFDHLGLIASVKIRPIESLGVSRVSNDASVGAMSAGLLTAGNFPAAMPAP